MFLIIKRIHQKLPVILALVVIFVVSREKVHAQNGVAPSQTGLFFDDLRNRANAFRSDAVDESATTRSSGVYDYSRGEYSGQSYDERALGERAPTDEDLARGLGQASNQAGYLSRTKRSVDDYGRVPGAYSSTSTYFAPTYITDPFLAGKRNLKIGPVNIGLGLHSNLEYNDNVSNSSTNQVGDMIGGLYLNVDANYQITQKNRLSLSMMLGVDHYFEHPELSPNGDDFVLNVFPGSTLAFDIKVGDVMFVLYDRVSVQPASQDEFALNKQDLFGVFQNDIGLAASWAINSKLNLSLNYNHSDEIATQDAFSYTDRSIDSVSGSLAWTPTGTYTIGLEGSYSVVNYDEDFQNDGTTATAGVFVVVPLTKHTIIKASAGIQEFNFDSPPTFSRSVTAEDLVTTQNAIAFVDQQTANVVANAAVDPVMAQQQQAALVAQRQQLSDLLAAQQVQKQIDDTNEVSRTYDNSNLSDYYYNVTLFNQLNDRISHQLSFGHESALNNNSNFVTSDYVSYGVGIIAWRGSRLTINGYMESNDESGGRLSEDTDQWGIDALLTHRLTDRITLGLGYHYGNTDSEFVNRDYTQSSYTLDFNYALNAKLNVGLGYRFLTTNAEDDTLDYDQNRFIMSMNYNF